MTETTWIPADLARWGDTEEIRISTRRADGTLRGFVPIWIVAADGSLYVRSYRGTDGAWYQHACRNPAGRIHADAIDQDVRFAEPDPGARTAVDAAYRAKYARYSDSYLRPMLTDTAVAATLRLDPRTTTAQHHERKQS
ncbi:DUF2255 family protein [Nocardia miyunensis]|uniref:DUF2255 family protein n=1 Tax=Nocardia miyunensis TaxID=282684 RepID=UPI00082E67EA|nr:DUF2255 family protein [Nocardia miyunensis]